MNEFDDLRIRELRFFDRLAALGSITAAAAELGVPKPTASRWLADLERKVGQPLVHRTTRQLALTERGRAFHERVSELLSMADAARRVAQDEQPGGKLRVSVPVPLGRMVAGQVVAGFRRRLPGVQLVVRLQNERVDLVRDSFDVAIRGGALPSSDLVARKLTSVALWLYASAWVHADSFDAQATPLIAGQGDARLLARARSWRVTAAAILDDRMAIADALVAGAGFGVLPAFLGEALREAGEIVRLEAQPLTMVPVHALYMPAQRDDLRVRVFIDELESHLRLSTA